MAVSFAIPFVLSFDRKVAFYKSFVPLFKAIVAVAPIFLVWDILFTHFGYWGFNDRYISGVSFLGLPLGEYLFFFVIPYCCVFVYEVLNSYIQRDVLGPYQITISNFLMGFSAALAVVYYDKWYTVITFSFVLIIIYWHSRVKKTEWLSRFYLSYLVVLIPFIVVNGILTGMGLTEEVVWYNDLENSGTRFFTIPIEDFFYGLLLVLIIVSFFEYLRKREGYRLEKNK